MTYAPKSHIHHYLNDFVVLGVPGSEQCAVALDTLHQECRLLGVPIAKHKTKGPATCHTFSGIEVNMVAFELRLPEEKLAHLRAQLEAWGDRKACLQKELESLVGLLNHTCRGIRSGRSFLRRMIDLLHSVPDLP